MKRSNCKVGQRGTIVIPAAIRERLGLTEGSLVIVEESSGAIILRPAVAVPVEEYTPARKAQFLLNNATDETDYAQAVKDVRAMGLDPDEIPHQRP